MTKVKATNKSGTLKSVNIKPVESKCKTANLSKPLKISLDEIDFQPKEVEKDFIYQVKLCCPYQPSYNKQCNVLLSKTVEVLDFGIKLEFSEEEKNLYTIRAELLQEFSARGLLLSNVYLDNNNRLKMIVVNAGPTSPLILGHKELFANVWLENRRIAGVHYKWSHE